MLDAAIAAVGIGYVLFPPKLIRLKLAQLSAGDAGQEMVSFPRLVKFHQALLYFTQSLFLFCSAASVSFAFFPAYASVNLQQSNTLET